MPEILTDNKDYEKDIVNSISLNNTEPHKLRRSDANNILKAIQENNPISVYDLAKLIQVSYPTTARVCKNLEFAGLIKSRIEIGEKNKAKKILFIDGRQNGTKN